MVTIPKFTPDPRIARLMGRSDVMLGMALQPRPNPLPQNPYYIPGMAGMVGQLGSGLLSRQARMRGKDIENRQKMAQQMLGAALDPSDAFVPPAAAEQEEVGPIRKLARKVLPPAKTDAEIYTGLKGLGTGEIGVIAGANPFDIANYKASLGSEYKIYHNPKTRTIVKVDEKTGKIVWQKTYSASVEPAPWFLKENEENVIYRVNPEITDDLTKTTDIWNAIARGISAITAGLNIPWDIGVDASKAAKHIALVQKQLVKTLIDNPRFPWAEQELVGRIVPQGDQVFAKPEVLHDQYANLLKYIVNRRHNLEEERLHPTTDNDRIREIEKSISVFNEAVRLLTGRYGTSAEVLDPTVNAPLAPNLSTRAAARFEGMTDVELRNIDRRGLRDNELVALIAEFERRNLE